MSDIMKMIKYCHVEMNDECIKCPAWLKENYICKNVRGLEEEFANKLFNDYENLVIQMEKWKKEHNLLYTGYRKYKAEWLDILSEAMNSKSIIKDLKKYLEEGNN